MKTWNALLDAQETAYRACVRYLGGKPRARTSFSKVQEALVQLGREENNERHRHDAVRPEGKLPYEHPWHEALGDLNQTIKIGRMLVMAVYRRAKAHRDGALAEYDAREEARIDAESKRFARAAAEIDRREARIGRALDPELRERIVNAYLGRV